MVENFTDVEGPVEEKTCEEKWRLKETSVDEGLPKVWREVVQGLVQVPKDSHYHQAMVSKI